MVLSQSPKKPRTTACAWSCEPREGEGDGDEAALKSAENARGVGSLAMRTRAADKADDEDEVVMRPRWRRVRHVAGFRFR